MKAPVLLVALLLAPGTAALGEAPPEVAAQVEKGVKAYNAQDLTFYEDALAPEVVYIADDGATFVGKERVLRLFTRLFGSAPPPQVAISEVVTGGRGDVAWARFKFTLTRGDSSRKGVCSTLLARKGEQWEVLQIQSTPDAHAMGGHD